MIPLSFDLVLGPDSAILIGKFSWLALLFIVHFGSICYARLIWCFFLRCGIEFRSAAHINCTVCLHWLIVQGWCSSWQRYLFLLLCRWQGRRKRGAIAPPYFGYNPIQTGGKIKTASSAQRIFRPSYGPRLCTLCVWAYVCPIHDSPCAYCAFEINDLGYLSVYRNPDSFHLAFSISLSSNSSIL